MKTFKQYLSEENAKSVFQLIATECSEALNACLNSHHLIVRGQKTKPPSSKNLQLSSILKNELKKDFIIGVGEQTPRQNRKPKNSPISVQRAFDDYAESKFGWRPRQTGVFCTSVLSDARFYGEVYAIFPKNGFKFIYHSEVPDFFIKFDSVRRPFNLHSFEEQLDEFIYEHGDYQNTDLEGALEEGVEIMLGTDSYYAIKIDDVRELILDAYDYANEIGDDSVFKQLGIDPSRVMSTSKKDLLLSILKSEKKRGKKHQ